MFQGREELSRRQGAWGGGRQSGLGLGRLEATSLPEAASGLSGQDLPRGQQSQDHKVSWGQPCQPMSQPRRSACSWWATFSSSASMADRLSSSWSSGLRLALPSSSFFSSG